MPMLARKCRYVPLAKQPLVLVLGQVRFSPVRKIGDYILGIQEAFRRHGFPIERAGRIQQLTIGPTGVHATEQERWEYPSGTRHGGIERASPRRLVGHAWWFS